MLDNKNGKISMHSAEGCCTAHFMFITSIKLLAVMYELADIHITIVDVYSHRGIKYIPILPLCL